MSFSRLRLGHVNIRADSLEATVAFYERVLGLRRAVSATNPDPTQNLWLLDDEGRPCVHVNQLRPGETRSATGPIDHFAFDCDDRSSMEAHLTSVGVAFEAIDFPAGGIVQLNLRDPNGVKVELTFRNRD